MICGIRPGKAVMALAVMLAAGSLWGQRLVTSETAMTGNGEFEFGYSGSSTSEANSGTSSMYVGLLGSFLGYWRDPRILSFSVAPNWRWDTDSTVDTSFGSGNESVLTTLRFLSGSDTPLSINYNLDRLTMASLTGGLAPVTVRSRGLSQNFNINWSIHKHERNKADRWPTLVLTYGKGWSDNSVTGVEAPTLSSDSSSFTAQSAYQILGFHLTAAFLHQDINQNNSNLLDLGLPTQVTSKSQTETLSVTRTFFKNTSVAAGYATSKGDVEVLNTPSNTNFDSANATVNTNPWTPLNLNGTVNYISNEAGQTLTNIATGTPPPSGSGGVVPQLLLSTGREVDGALNGTYILSPSWQFLGTATRLQTDLYGGIKIDNDTFTGGVLFSHRVGKGFLTLAYTPGYFTVDEYVSSEGTQQQVKEQGLVNAGQVRYARQVKRWRGSGGLTFSQSNISQPTVVPLVSRFISGNLSATTLIRNEWTFNGTYVVSQSSYAGANGSLSNNFSGSIGNRTWNFMGQYQFNSGYAISTPFGLVPVTGTTTGSGTTTTATGGTATPGAPGTALPAEFFTTANGFSFSAAYRRRRLQVTATYGHNGANVTSPLQVVNSATSTLNALAEYRFRRIKVRAGFFRFGENVSGNNALNQASNTWYVTLIRPFHIF